MRICQVVDCANIITIGKRVICQTCRLKEINDEIYYHWCVREWPTKTFTKPPRQPRKTAEEIENDKQRLIGGQYQPPPANRSGKRRSIKLHGKPRKKRKPSKYFPDGYKNDDAGKSETSG